MPPKRVTTEDLVKRARKIHGDRYDYSKTNYINSKTKVIITCQSHGDFLMTMGNHTHKTRPQNCPKCMKVHRYDTNEWINHSKSKFGDKFDYSDTVYVNARTKLVIKCNIHGNLLVDPTNHIISPTGCERCSSQQTGLSQRRTQESLIRQFVIRHGDRYDYSKVDYQGDSKNIIIICKVHGEFSQRAIAHANGRNCNDCMNEQNGINARLSTEDFIRRSNEVHNGKYDYSLVDYLTSDDDVTIICPKHGEFRQRASNHVNNNYGCWECGQKESGINRRVTDIEWKERFNIVHQDMYDYTNFQSSGAMNKSKIRCRKHGDFLQEPIVHAKGHGCPKCLKKNQTKVYNFLKEIFPNQEIYYDFKHPDLRFSSSNAKMELDIWIPDLSLAVEYQGEQHYEKFWRGNFETNDSQSFESQIKRDEEKRKSCIDNGIILIEIPYTWDKTITYIRNAISESVTT